ncbi:MAG TPA: F0F1 ATP synthase subunit A [Dehalococcoidia bacterium]|nr:F0F1 ATP synthase subunit A [Dehalococcoidia bacterium]
MPKLGCATRTIVFSLVIILVLFIVGFVFGPLGASFFGIEVPAFMAVSKPHVVLPSEGLFEVAGFSITNTLIASWLTIIVLASVFYVCTRKMRLIPGRLQNLAEMAVEALLSFVKSVAGDKHARLLFPAVATIFIYVITNAYLALLPFFGTIVVAGHEGELVPLFRSANTDINVPLSIALMSFVFIEFWGMKSLGGFRYLGEFFNFGQLGRGVKELFTGKIRPAITNIAFGFINLFVGTLEVFSHLIRVVSFTFRLFGNMTAGEILLLVSAFLIPFIFTIPFYGLELLIGFIQALIFAGLTLVFGIIAVSPAHEEKE